MLEDITRCCASVCDDIVTAIEQPQEDIDFDAILRPYYDTIHSGTNGPNNAALEVVEKEAGKGEVEGEGVADDGLGNRSDGCSINYRYTAETRVETVIVKIPEPEYYEEFRAMHEKEFAALHSATDSIS